MVGVIQLNKARIWKCREFKNIPPWDDRVSVCVIKQIFAALGECYPRVTLHPLRSLQPSEQALQREEKKTIRIFYLIMRVSPRLPRCPGGPGPRLLRPGPRLLLALSLRSCCQLRPRPPAGSLIDKELTQYDALANVTTRWQETLRCLGSLHSLYDSHIVGLEAGGGGRADPQLLDQEPAEAVQILNFSAATSVCCNNATSRPDRPKKFPVN